MENKKYKRKKVKCPLRQVELFHLPRHMVCVHGHSKEKARYSRSSHGIYTQHSTKKENPKFKDYHKKSKCPIPSCGAVVFRLPRHMLTVHKMSLSGLVK